MAAAAARHCAADKSRPSNNRDDYELASQGAEDEGSFAAGQRLSAMGASNCGAVDPSPTLATDSELDFPPIPPRQSPRRPLVCHRCALATAVFRIMRLINSYPDHRRYVVRFKGLTCSRSRKSSDHFLDRSWLKCGSPSIGPRVFSNWSAREEVNPWIDKRSCAHCSNNTGRFTGRFRLPSKSITRGMVAPIGVRLSGS